MIRKILSLGVIVTLGVFIITRLDASETALSRARIIKFQGRVKSANADRVFNGDYNVTVALYTAVTNPGKPKTWKGPVWSEYHSDVLFKNGFFSVQIGSVKALSANVLATKNLEIGIHLEGETFYFPMSSIPYVVQAGIAEGVISADASKLDPSGVFKAVTLNASLTVGETKGSALFVNSRAKTIRVGGGVQGTPYKLDVNGDLNATRFFLNGVSLLDTFDWQRNKVSTKNIYFLGEGRNGFVGINDRTPKHRLAVEGVINAPSFLRNGLPISAGLEWQRLEDDLVFVPKDKKLGIGTVDPRERVDIAGGILIKRRHDVSAELLQGALWFDSGKFYGFNGVTTNSLAGIEGNGSTDRIPFWDNSSRLTNSLSFVWKDKKMGVGTNSPVSTLTVMPDNSGLAGIRIVSRNSVVFFESPSGRFLIGKAVIPPKGFMDIAGFTPLSDSTAESKSLAVFNELVSKGFLDSDGHILDLFNPETPTFALNLDSIPNSSIEVLILDRIKSYRAGRIPDDYLITKGKHSYSDFALKVNGALSGADLRIYGLPLRFAISKGSEFLSDRTSFVDAKANIFYMEGNVSIGQPESDNLLQIGAPYKETDIDVPTKDPVIGFRYISGVSEASYLFGVDADGPGVLRIENSNQLGSGKPLFVALENQFGVGTTLPKSNLHVSGNYGFIVRGQLDVSPSLQVTGPGTRMLFQADKGALRVGHVSNQSVLSGADWDPKYIGEFSIGLGNDSVSSGNFSTVVGGNKNLVGGAYSTAVGGASNVVNGFFAVGLGSEATIPKGHHGSFVWADKSLTSFSSNPFSSSSYNQFVLRSELGVGIGTNETIDSALTVQSRPILKSDFMQIFPVLDDLDASVEVWNALKSDNYIDSNGYFNKFMPRFYATEVVQVFPVTFKISQYQLYSILASKYRTNSVISRSDFVSDLTLDATTLDFSKSIWIENEKALKSLELWKWLVDKKILKSDSSFDSFDPSVDKVLKTSGSNLVDSESDLYDFLKQKFDNNEKVSAVSFQDLVKTSFYEDPAFDNWITSEAKISAASKVFVDLVSSRMIRSNGRFDLFRPVFDFTRTSFNGQRTTTTNIFNVLLGVYDQNNLRTLGNRNLSGMTISNAGRVGVGYTNVGTAALAINGPLSIGTTQTLGRVTIESKDVSPNISSRNYAFAVYSSSDRVTPSFVINTRGMVGVKQFHDNLSSVQYKPSDNVLLAVDGAVIASGFKFPTGESLSVKPPHIDWLYENTTPNIYFVSGNVGIGTISPNSLLELSNLDGKNPIIGFDLNGTDYYGMGMSQADSTVFRLGNSGDLMSSKPDLAVRNKFVGINTRVPSGSLHVSGNVIVDYFYVGTENRGVARGRAPLVYAKQFLRKGSVVLDWIWGNDENTRFIYTLPNDMKVGVGKAPVISETDEGIDVAGTTSANSIVVSKVMHAKEALDLKSLSIREGYVNGSLYVKDKGLWLGFGGVPLSVSEVLSFGEGLKGPLAVWDKSNLNRIGQTPFIWQENSNKIAKTGYEINDPAFLYSTPNARWVWNKNYDYLNAGALILTGNLSIVKSQKFKTLDISNSVKLGVDRPLDQFHLESALTYEGGFFDKTHSFSVSSMNISINSEVSGNGSTVMGSSVKLSTDPDSLNRKSYITNDAIAYGLLVDVSQVNVQSGGPTTKGFRFPALFNGDVGIGGYPARDLSIDPKHSLLEVKGFVQADSFDITDRMQISTVNVNGKVLYVDAQGRVGINVTTPLVYALSVNGTAYMTDLNVNRGLLSQTLSAHQDRFVVNQNGFVGVGITAPSAGLGQLEIYKLVSSPLASEFNFQKSEIVLNHSVSKNITGLDMKIGSRSDRNKLTSGAIGTGIDVSFKNISKVVTGSALIGVRSQTTSTYNAIFKGGVVGIGTTTPESGYALDVKGTLRGYDLVNTSFARQPEGIQLSQLYVTNNAIFGVNNSSSKVTANALYSNNLILKNVSVSKLSSYNVGLDVQNLLIATVVSTNTQSKMFNLNSTKLVSAKTGAFETQLSIGTTVIDDEALVVRGGLTASKITVNYELNAQSLVVSSSRKVVVDPSYRLGIRVVTPSATIDSVVSAPEYTMTAFVASNNATWFGARIQSGISDIGHSTGLEFVPGDGANKVGLVAVKTALNESDLAVVGGEAERFRLTSSGRIGIGTSAPDTSLAIVGSANVSNYLRVSGNVAIEGIAGVNGIALNGKAFIRTTSNFSILSTERYVAFNPTSYVSRSGSLPLYSDTSSKHHLMLGSSPMSASLNLTEGTIPFYGAVSFEAVPTLHKWDAINSQYQIGSPRHIFSSLSTQNITSYVEKTVSVNFKNRTISGSNVFYGTHISGGGTSLHDDDVVTGLTVDLSDLRTESTLIIEDDVYSTSGKKYAATFRGGSVGIAPYHLPLYFRPSANLHIVNVTDNVALRVFNDALVVSKNGYVGISQSIPAAPLDVSGSIYIGNRENNVASLVVEGNSIGLGRAGTQALEISGTLLAKQLETVVFKPQELKIATSGLVVKSNGNVGIGISDPSAQFQVLKTLKGEETTTFAQEKLQLDYLHNVTVPNTGVLVGVSAAKNNSFGGTKTLTGMKLSYPVTAHSDSAVLGVSVQTNSTSDDDFSALFNGGNVGIGVTNPISTLEVDGDLKGGTFNYVAEPSSLSVLSGLANGYTYISGNVAIEGDFDDSQSHVFVDHLLFKDQNSDKNLLEQIGSSPDLSMWDLYSKGGSVMGGVAVGGATLISKAFTVKGDAVVTKNNLSIGGSNLIPIKGLNSVGNMVISTPRFFDSGFLSADGYIGTRKLHLYPISTPNFASGTGTLFISNNNNGLYYLGKVGSEQITINLTSPGTGTAYAMPFFYSGDLQGDTFVSLKDSVLTFGANKDVVAVYGDRDAMVRVDSYLNSTKIVNKEAIEDLKVGFTRRVKGESGNLGTLDFSGVSIVVTGDAELNANDRIVGVSVNMTNLIAESRSEDLDGPYYRGEKYSALFNGGAVLVVTSGNRLLNEAPSANLHIRNNTTRDLAFSVKDRALVVSVNFGVGIGTDHPKAALDVDNSLQIIGVSDAEVKSKVLVIDNDKVGIGGSSNTALGVKGAINATKVNAAQLNAGELNVATNGLVVNSSGFIGIGVTNPSAQLDVLTKLNGSYSDSFAFETINLVLNKTASPKEIETSSAGLGIVFRSAKNNSFGNTNTATGLSVKIPMAAESESKVIGVDVKTDTNSASKIAAVFRGGNVGIGVTEPEYQLDMDGNFSAKSMILTDSVLSSTFQSATINNLVVTSDANFPNATFVLKGQQHVRFNELRFRKQNTPINFLTLATKNSTLEMDDLTAVRGYTSSTVNVGSLGKFVKNTFHVEGDAYFEGSVSMNGTLSVSGVTKMGGKTPTTISANRVVISAASTSNIQMDGFQNLPGLVLPQTFVRETDLTESNKGWVYASSAATLNYAVKKSNKVTSVNILGLLQASSSKYAEALPFLDLTTYKGFMPTSGNLKTNLSWSQTNNKVSVRNGSLGVTASAIISYISPTDSSALPVGVIKLGFGNRSSLSSSDLEFYGVNVVVSENGKNVGSILPSSGKNEVVGLKVDMSSLVAISTTSRPADLDYVVEGKKYAATFMGGGVGIVATGNRKTLLAESELLHVTMNGQTKNLPFVAESYAEISGSIVTYNAIVVTRDGTVAVGFLTKGTKPQLSSRELSVIAFSGEQSVFATSNVSFGMETSSAKLAIYSQDKSIDAFRVSTIVTQNVLKVTSKGGVNIGNVDSASGLAVSGDIKTLFEVSTGNANRFYVQRNGQVRVLFDSDPIAGTAPFALTVSGNYKDNGIVMSGYDKDIKYVTLAQKNGGANQRFRDFYSAGFAATLASKNIVFGITSGNVLGQNFSNARLSVSANRFVLSNFDGVTAIPVMTVLTSGNVLGMHPKIGLFTSQPKANLHLQGLTGKALMQVSTENNWAKRGFSISELGFVSIGTTRSDVELVVSGTVFVNSIQETSSRNTLFKTVSLLVTPNGSPDDYVFKLDHSITDGKGHTAGDIQVILDRDLQLSQMTGPGRKSLIGMEVSMNSILRGSAPYGIGASSHYHGLKVDVSDLLTGDPTFGTAEGTYASAVFLSTFGTGADLIPDAKVGIGTDAPTVPLEVRMFNGKGVSATSGNIVAFNTGINYLDPSVPNYGTLLTFSLITTSQNYKSKSVPSYVNTDKIYFSRDGVTQIASTNANFAQPILTVDSFQTIKYTQKDGSGISYTYTVGYEDAESLMTLLRDKGVLEEVNEKATDGTYVRVGAILRKSSAPSLVGTNYFATSGGLFVPSASVLAVLNQFYYRSIFSLKTFDMDENPTKVTYNALVMVNGTNALKGENAFVSSILINGGEDKLGTSPTYIPSLEMLGSRFFREVLQVGGKKSAGDMRVGTSPSKSDMGSPGDGAKLYFSGGPKLGTSSLDDSENTDEMVIHRVNESAGVNSFKIHVGEKETEADSGFYVGISPSYESKIYDKFITQFAIKAYSLETFDETGLLPEGTKDPATGFVGIGTNSPQALLHVYGKQGGSEYVNDYASRSVKKHLVMIENTAEKVTGTKSYTASPNTLSIRYSKDVLKEGDNFMTFLINSDLENQLDSVGAIEGNPGGTYTYTSPSGSVVEGEYEDGGVAYSSPERDYAEYIEKLDPNETFEKGDVVGIFGGKVSHKTKGADHVMVISSTPIIVGNWQSTNLNRYALVAFLGQVPVRVKGIVNKGDYLVPSGQNDGCAIAVSSSEITSETVDKVLGRSWNESQVTDEKQVLSIIGFPFGFESFETHVSSLRKEVQLLSHSTTVLESELSARYEKRQQIILDLKKRLMEIKN